MKKENFTISVLPALLEEELTSITLACKWRDLEIHFVKKASAPHVLLEVNRISTVMFNLNSLDSDIYDDTYGYIVVYDRHHREIVSFYRYMFCKDAIYGKHDIRLSTATYFTFSDEFVQNILPSTIEFGRSVVNKIANRSADGLEAVWKGLGLLIYEYNQHVRGTKIDYFFGKFSIQWNLYSESVRNMILYLFKTHFPPVYGSDNEIYIKPKFEYETMLDFEEAESKMNSGEYKSDRKILLQHLQSIGLKMPNLAQAYANLGGLKSFGTIFNDHLKSWETAILQKIDEIDSFYLRRFVDGYTTTNELLFEELGGTGGCNVYQPFFIHIFYIKFQLGSLRSLDLGISAYVPSIASASLHLCHRDNLRR